jgi:hypothetical protein
MLNYFLKTSNFLYIVNKKLLLGWDCTFEKELRMAMARQK